MSVYIVETKHKRNERVFQHAVSGAGNRPTRKQKLSDKRFPIGMIGKTIKTDIENINMVWGEIISDEMGNFAELYYDCIGEQTKHRKQLDYKEIINLLGKNLLISKQLIKVFYE